MHHIITEKINDSYHSALHVHACTCPNASKKEGVLIHEIGNATSIIWILKGMVSTSVIRTMHWGHVIIFIGKQYHKVQKNIQASTTPTVLSNSCIKTNWKQLYKK